ncbi:PKD domain-containing protein [Luteococcus sp.]|uniref:PKD domain-containing protein n=1 Tax=Luteococcus sp. TaxID=1969402 RepID=UPI003736FABE
MPTPLVNHALRIAASSAAATLLLLAQPATEASASVTSTYNVVPRSATDVTADALPTTQIDGIAWDQEIVGNTVYVGGEFANARPAGAAPGTQLTPRSNLLAYDLATGVLRPGFAPVVNGAVRTVTVSPDGSKLYIGGNFTAVNGQPRQRIAAFNTSDGSLDADFHPDANAEVTGIVATNEVVYFGGAFSTVDGNPRGRLAAATTGGALTGWTPVADLTVQSVVLTPDGSQVAVGGSFNAVNGQPSPGLAFINPVNGTMTPMAATQVVQNHGTTSGIYSLVNDGTNLLATGWWYGGVGSFEGVMSMEPRTGSIRWLADCHGDSYDATSMDGTTYSVSHHHTCTNMGSFNEQVPQVFERTQAFTDRATTITRHDQTGYHDFHGQPAPSRVEWAPKLEAANLSRMWQAAWTVESGQGYVVMGGEFPRVNGQPQQGLVRFARPGIGPGKSGPQYTWNWTPTATVVGTSVKIAWPANVDRDDLELTYRLYRDDRPGTPIATTTAESAWYERPVLGHLDTDLTVGKSYSYWVTATDANGNVAQSQRVRVTAGSTSIPATDYSRAVDADGAWHYWRLLENPGATTSIDWRKGNDLVLGSGVTLGQAGAIGDGTDSAARFDGTAASRSHTASAQDAPQRFTIELWMKTATTAGGKLVGFGDQPTADSRYHDRAVYMGTDGRLHFGLWNGSAKVISSATSFNDDKYHHVVASVGDGGQQLWVDGRLAAADSTTTQATQDIFGHWRVGGDQLGGWPSAEGVTNDFAGTLDEVAVYTTPLTRDQVRSHYTASGRSLPLPALPKDPYGSAVVADEPRLLWRLDETRAPVVLDASQNLTNGTWFGTPTMRTPSPVTGAAGTGVLLDGSATGIAADAHVNGPQVFSTETWFSTTSTAGGKLVGFGNERTGLSSHYDRHTWMDPEGRLHFGVYSGGFRTVDSAKAYNDGKWHHVVSSMGPNGMQMFVDGELVGTNPTATAEDFAGYWRVGGDSTWSGSPWFAGAMDETAVYGQVLSADQVRAHYRASAATRNQDPEPSFTVTCSGATCTFDASASTDPDGIVGSHSWDFGDGTRATGVKATRTFTTGGTHTVTLTVADDQAARATTTRQVSVTVDNKAPVADIKATCDGLDCTFDGTGSTDAEGPVKSYLWDFGDGTTSTEPKAAHGYAKAGTYTATLTVTDADGARTTSTHQVVLTPENVAPTAAFTPTVDDLALSVDASASTDPDGTIASYAWDFGDGTMATGVKATHTYAEPGTYPVILTVTDDKGGTNSRTVEVTAAGPTNQPPTATFDALVDGRSVAFDASPSSDPDGTIVSWEWAFGDGTTGTGETVTHTYPDAGSYTATLTVTDDSGQKVTTTRAVTIAEKANQAPTAAFTGTVDGLALQLDASGSTDADGSIASYEWTFTDGSTATGRTVQHVFTEAGSQEVRLTVVDDAGAKATTSQGFTVVAPLAPAPEATVIARDAFGQTETRWGTADLGGAWSHPVAPAAFTTDGSAGLQELGAGRSARALLTGVQASDVTIGADLSVDRIPTGSGLYSQLLARQGSTGYYGLGTRWRPDGKLELLVYRNSGGVTSTLKQAAVSGTTYRPGSVLHVRFEVSGSPATLSGSLWADGQQPPATAQISVTDATAALQRPGAVGTHAYLSGSTTNGPVTLAMDNFVVTKEN